MTKKQVLTEKQKRFADYYIELGNATEAAIKANYSKKTARMIASENLHKPHIRAYIDEALSKKDAERIASQDEILEFLTAVMRGEVTEPVAVLDGDGYQKVVDLKPNAQARRAAAELLGKRHMMWTDRQRVDNNVMVQIVDDIGEEE